MQFKNATDKLANICIPYPEGPMWITAEPNAIVDVPEEHAFRALAHGFVKIGEEKKGSEILDKKITEVGKFVLKPALKKKVKDDLSKVKGLGKKAIDEIAEEYDSIEDIISDIKAGRFSVGGIDKKKKEEILSKFK